MLKVSLLITVLISWTNAQPPDTSCPSNTVPLGPLGTRATRQSILPYGVKRLVNPTTRRPYTDGSSRCQQECESYSQPRYPTRECNAFMYFGYSGYCYLYQQTAPQYYYMPRYPPNRPPSYPYDNVVCCAITNRKILCPVGTTQIGEAGGYVAGGTALAELQNTVTNIQECEKECCDNEDCKAFLFDDDPNLCHLYESTDNAVEATGTVDPDTANMVLCQLDADGDECPLEGECPSGTNQIGLIGQIYSGQQVDYEYYKTIEECADLCRCNEDCLQFAFDDNIGSPTAPKSLCRLFQRGSLLTTGPPNNRVPRLYKPPSSYAQQIICAIEQCPSASTEIPANGQYLYYKNRIKYVYGTKVATIELCQHQCKNTDGCVAYTYDYDTREYTSGRFNSAENPSDNRCFLYSATTPSRAYVPGATYGDAISCALNTGSSSALSGLLNVDSPNGNNGIAMSTYIIYGVIGLLLVNIICLTINCWNKCNGGNKRRYKVVSMRSDDESTDV